jgi:hypothetical protein
VVAKRNAFKPFQVHEMKVNNKARQKMVLKCKISQVERDLNLQEIFKSIPIPRKKTIVMIYIYIYIFIYKKNKNHENKEENKRKN